jgi:4-amino-4-deoxy-L-arabinose transferase-like glycosyltransferase
MTQLARAPRAILFLFVLISLIYLVVTPPFEASDELWHFGMIQQIATTGALPVQVPGVETAWEQEGSQPPLYYLIGAALVAPFDRSDFDLLRQPNPHAKAGIPGDMDNKNLVLHTAYPAPPRRTALAVYVVRLFSVACSVVSIYAIYRCARLLVPNAPLVATVAAGITALNPMFLFISASVNNDNLVTMLNALIIWQLLALLGSEPLTTRRGIIIAVLFALATLTKLSALVLAPFILLVVLWVTLRERQWGMLLRFGALWIGVWAIAAAWWYVRNIQLYDELFGTRTMVEVAGARLEPFTLQTLVDEFEGFRISFWGLFGAVNILTHPAFYIVMDIVTIISVIGVILFLRRADRAERLRVALLGGITIAGMGAVIAWTAQTYASQGRLLFPFMAAIAPLLALGLWQVGRMIAALLPPRGHDGRYAAAALTPLALVAVAAPLLSIAPVYAIPQPTANLLVRGGDSRPVFARFENVTLMGYFTAPQRYEAGDEIPITVIWLVEAPDARNLSLYLHAADRGGNVIGRIDSYPGAGRLQTTTWQPGLYTDSYRIRINEAIEASDLRIQVGWWDYPTGTLVNAVDEAGAPLESVMLDVGAVYAPPTLPDDMTTITPVTFGDSIRLDGYALDGDVVTLAWTMTAPLAADYTVFAQVLDVEGQLVGQGDTPPPIATRYLAAGDTFTTTHTLTYPQPLAAGTYRLIIGWYEAVNFGRLTAAYPDNAYPLYEFTVTGSQE